MENLKENNEGHHPIIIKCPSGITSREHLCKDVPTAIEYIKKRSPEHLKAALEKLQAQEKKRLAVKVVEDSFTELQLAETTLKQEEAKARKAKASLHDLLADKGEQNAVQFEWMFEDAGSGWDIIGLGGVGRKLARLNRARWSQKKSLSMTQEMLEDVAQEDTKCGRPVLMRICKEGEKPTEKTFEDVEQAVVYVRSIIANLDPELMPLQNAHADARNRLAAANTHVKKAKKTLRDSQAQAKAVGALN